MGAIWEAKDERLDKREIEGGFVFIANADRNFPPMNSYKFA